MTTLRGWFRTRSLPGRIWLDIEVADLGACQMVCGKVQVQPRRESLWRELTIMRCGSGTFRLKRRRVQNEAADALVASGALR